MTNIKTAFISPPIPDRSKDWHARFAFEDGDDLTCEGWGATEEEAVIDLLDEAAYDDAMREEVINLAFSAWKGGRE